jgi:IclR family transcriptional regulator, acetate operon repressor
MMGHMVARTSANRQVVRGTPMGSGVRLLRVCEALGRSQPVGVRELAREVELPRSSVQRALETLEAAGWALRTDAGVWCLSSRPALIAAQAGSAGMLRELAGPALTRLQAETDESVRLWVRQGRDVSIVLSVESAQPVRYVGPPAGTTLPLHASAAGKAILAALPDAEVDALLSGPLDARTPHTIVEADALRAQLAEPAARGYAVTRHEAHDDVGGVAAAVLDAAGLPIGALSVSLPMHRLTDDLVEQYGALVVREAARLSELATGAAVR